MSCGAVCLGCVWGDLCGVGLSCDCFVFVTGLSLVCIVFVMGGKFDLVEKSLEFLKKGVDSLGMGA